MAIIEKKQMKKQRASKKKLTRLKRENIFVYSFYTVLVILFITMFSMQFSQEELSQDNQSYTKEKDVITVYKTPSCGCCKKWISHLEDSPLKEMGFKVKVIDNSNMSQIKNQYGIPSGARSCHTAVINDYVIEGHVPAADIIKLLSEKRAVVGLAVPGMPIGSPGMERDRVDQYSVYEFDTNGKVKEINQY